MIEFNVYHLDHNHPEVKGEIEQLLQRNRSLDMSVVKEYVSSRAKEFEIVDGFKSMSSHDFIDNKCKRVLAIHEAGAYGHVATVQANNLVDVLKLTNSINGYWFFKPNKYVKVVNEPERDTKSYDLITHKNKMYLVNTCGFVDVNVGKIFTSD